MNQQEQQEWINLLSPTTEGQIAMLRDLLQHRYGDKMIHEDVVICRRWLKQLTEEASSCDECGRDRE